MKNLVIVESPAKAKTIEGYLGEDFVVKSSYGHVRDLPKGNNAIDIEHEFKPTYEVTDDKKEVVRELKKLSKEATTVWLASDDDREGEAISWHLYETLGLKQENTRRIVFREITKKAILNAIENPRNIDMDLVNAQQARRILDRLVGFELSPILWKKIKRGLSAGRVQSVAVRLIVDREREVEQFKSQYVYKVSALFELENKKTVKARLSQDFKTEEEANAFLTTCIAAKYSISSLEKKEARRSPAAPFTTSTLQQEASRKLGFSVSQTMTVAQRLYESGKISYMRTDSVNLSETAIEGALQEIKSAYGAEFAETRRYKTKNESAQEAHEAVRPTDFAKHKVDGEKNEQRLYELIWKRAIASQMSDALIEKTTAEISISGVNQKLVATGEVIKFEGFLKVYLETSDEEDEEEEASGVLPPLTIGQSLALREMKAAQSFSRPSARYTEASLVKKLEELGIGRPSTYAPTISTVQKRNYVEKENREGKERDAKELILKSDKITVRAFKETYGAEKAKLFPTDLAMIVNDFLVGHFPNVIDFGFTAKVEEEFDHIAEGMLPWEAMIQNFYKGFHQTVETTQETEGPVNTGRDLGFDPVTGLRVSVRLGKYGPFAQLGEVVEGEAKPQYASLKKGQLLETIELEDAIELFKLPRQVGEYEEKVMTVAIGRFGPYVRHDSKFYSLGKEDDPLYVTTERTIEIIEAKRKADSEKLIKEFEEDETVKVLNGRYGPYIVHGDKNVKIPKDKEPVSLTLAECLELSAATPEGKKKFGGKKTTATAAPAVKKTVVKKPAAKKPAAKKAAPKKK